MRLLNQPSVAVVPTKVIKWVKPNANKVKVQYDASIRGNGFVGIGFVARDSHELILGAGVDIILGNISIDCAEALTIKHAMVFTSNIDLPNIIVENDCRIVIDALTYW